MTILSFLRRDPVYVLVALLPLVFPAYLLKFTLAGLPLNGAELCVLVLSLAFAVRAEVWKPSFIHSELFSLPWVAMSLFVLAGVVSVWITPETTLFPDGTVFDSRMHALGILKGWILIPMLYGGMARTVFREHPSFIPYSIVAAGCSGLFLVAFGHFKIDGRFAGPFESANYLSLYLGPIGVGLLALLDREWNGLPRSFAMALVVVLGLAFLLTQSYAAFLAIWCVVFVYEWSRPTPSWMRMGVFLGASFLAFLVLILSPLGADKWVQFWDFTHRSSTSVRLEIYQIARFLISSHPWLGIGLGQFEVQYSNVAPVVLGKAPLEWVMIHPHNLFLALWLNMGLLGLVSFLALLRPFLAWFRERDAHFRFVAVFMLVQILVHGLFDTPYFKNDLAFLFWWIWAMVA